MFQKLTKTTPTHKNKRDRPRLSVPYPLGSGPTEPHRRSPRALDAEGAGAGGAFNDFQWAVTSHQLQVQPASTLLELSCYGWKLVVVQLSQLHQNAVQQGQDAKPARTLPWSKETASHIPATYLLTSLKSLTKNNVGICCWFFRLSCGSKLKPCTTTHVPRMITEYVRGMFAYSFCYLAMQMNTVFTNDYTNLKKWVYYI